MPIVAMMNTELDASDFVFWLRSALLHLDMTVSVGSHWFTAANPVSVKGTSYKPKPTPTASPSVDESASSKAGASISFIGGVAAIAVVVIAIAAILYRRRKKGQNQSAGDDPDLKSMSRTQVSLRHQPTILPSSIGI